MEAMFGAVCILQDVSVDGGGHPVGN